MTPHYTDPLVTLFLGDCVTVMAELEAESVDSVVCDPPYNLAFMGREWDKNLNHGPWATEAFRVLKPGGYLLAFGGTRTHHRLASAIEDAGFEIRDTLMWIYASGFPKSLDVSKALDKAAGAEREVVGFTDPTDPMQSGRGGGSGFASKISGVDERAIPITAPATDLARKWEGWGTALKPAHEPIVMARKPLVGTVAANVTRYGVGALNIEASRIGYTSEADKPTQEEWNRAGSSGKAGANGFAGQFSKGMKDAYAEGKIPVPSGRWPSNILLSDPELFDEPNPWVVGSGTTAETPHVIRRTAEDRGMYSPGTRPVGEVAGYGDSGGYSRFFTIPQRYNETCVRCGLAISAGPTSSPPSPSADSAPSDAPTSPAGTPDSMAPVTRVLRPGTFTTMPSGATTWQPSPESDTAESPTSKPPATSPESTPPSSHVKSPDATSPETGTTTTTPVRWMCGTCAADTTWSTTDDGLPEPYPRALIIPKADRKERERGLAGREVERTGESTWAGECNACGSRMMLNGKTQCGHDDMRWVQGKARANVHPTVKPIDLMRHLVRLVTPPGGVCLDPFLGSGTTALAASEEGFRCIGIEREAEYLEIAVGRLMATPMGLGLDVPIVGRRDIGKQRGNKDAEGRPTLEGPASLGSSWFHGKPDEEDAA